RSTVTVPNAVKQVGLALGRIPDRNATEAESVFDCLLERSGMIREATSADEGTGEAATIEFLHNTFKEFLAGEQIADEGLVNMLLKNLDHEGWRRAGLFAFAAGNKTFQNDLLKGVFEKLPAKLQKPTGRKKPTVAAEKARAWAVFALQCRAQAMQCDDTVK